MYNFLLTILTEQTELLQLDQGNCQPFGQLNATVERWILHSARSFQLSQNQNAYFPYFQKGLKARQFAQQEICKYESDIRPLQHENCLGWAIGS